MARKLLDRRKAQTDVSGFKIGTYDLDPSFNDTPELASTNLDRVAGSEATRLEMTAELVEDGFFEISEDSDSGQEVVEVRM